MKKLSILLACLIVTFVTMGCSSSPYSVQLGGSRGIKFSGGGSSNGNRMYARPPQNQGQYSEQQSVNGQVRVEGKGQFGEHPIAGRESSVKFHLQGMLPYMPQGMDDWAIHENDKIHHLLVQGMKPQQVEEVATQDLHKFVRGSDHCRVQLLLGGAPIQHGNRPSTKECGPRNGCEQPRQEMAESGWDGRP